MSAQAQYLCFAPLRSSFFYNFGCAFEQRCSGGYIAVLTAQFGRRCHIKGQQRPNLDAVEVLKKSVHPIKPHWIWLLRQLCPVLKERALPSALICLICCT